MGKPKKPQLFRGILAGLVGGLAAAWVMTQLIEGTGQKPQQPLRKRQGNAKAQVQDRQGSCDDEAPIEDATMKAAGAIVSTVTGGPPLSPERQEQPGPVAQYAFGAIMGALYGALAEYSSQVRAGFGSAFGSALFTAADLIPLPVFRLSFPPNDQPKSLLATPAVAHIVYGATTEFVRRLVRAIL